MLSMKNSAYSHLRPAPALLEREVPELTILNEQLSYLQYHSKASEVSLYARVLSQRLLSSCRSHSGLTKAVGFALVCIVGRDIGATLTR